MENMGWTSETVKSVLDDQVAELHKEIDMRVAELQREIRALATERHREHDKFENTVMIRFAQVNEFRGALDDLGKQMATRRELETLGSSMQQRIDVNAEQLGNLRSRIDIGPAALGTLQARVDAGQGLAKGLNMSIGFLLTGILAFSSLVSVIVLLLR
jgi:chromosome segregation ATPase